MSLGEQPLKKKGRWDQGINAQYNGYTQQGESGVIDTQKITHIPKTASQVKSGTSLVLERAKQLIEQAKKKKEEVEKQKQTLNIQQIPSQKQHKASFQQIAEQQTQQQQQNVSGQYQLNQDTERFQYDQQQYPIQYQYQQLDYQQEQQQQEKLEEKPQPYFDPRLGNRQQHRLNRRRKGALQFIQPGVYQKQAKIQRLKVRYGDMYEHHLEELNDDYEEKQKEIDLQMEQDEKEMPKFVQDIQYNYGDVPMFEWWDKLILNVKPVQDSNQKMQIDNQQQNGQNALNENKKLLKDQKIGQSKMQNGLQDGIQIQDQEIVSEINRDQVEEQVQGLPENDQVQENFDVLITPQLLRNNKITHLIEHPIPIEPQVEEQPPPPQPLKLTQREQKKLKTQKRLAREKEKQDLIRKGLLEPPKPKVKISNLFRVLGAQSAADPTAIETEVRRQMDEREQAHKDRNLIRQKSQFEKREKKLGKLFDQEQIDTLVSLYKVEGPIHPSNRFKIHQNALQNHLTGICIEHGPNILVIIEGGQKTIKRYQKLMLRRMDWTLRPDEDTQNGPNDGKCYLVWQGEIKEPTFKDFQMMKIENEQDILFKLSQHGVDNYYNLVQNYDPEIPFENPF